MVVVGELLEPSRCTGLLSVMDDSFEDVERMWRRFTMTSPVSSIASVVAINAEGWTILAFLL